MSTIFSESGNVLQIMVFTCLYVKHCRARAFIVKGKVLRSLVDATRHVFNVLGFVLKAAVVVVGLHTCLDFTPNGGTQLSAERTFLENNKAKII